MSKLQPVKPRGFRDRRARELLLAESLAEKIGEIYRRYGFEPLETPFIEFTDVLGKFLPDQDRPNEGVFSFRDDDDQWLSLRYDLTAPLARFFAENAQDLPLPFRSFRHGWVFRNEKSKPGRFRQFMQFDADSVGTASPAADAELCMMGADTLEYLGLRRGDYVIRVNNRKLMDAVMQLIGVDEPKRKLDIMRSMDKLDKIGLGGVEQLLGKGRMDESGDFTKGAGLPEKSARLILAFLGIEGHSGEETLAQIEELLGGNPIGKEGLAELRQMQALFAAAGYGADRIKIDPSVVRGLEYYTGPVFEAELKMAVVNKSGVVATIGSIGGGGRYDGLVARFSDEPVPATGFSIGLSRLMAALMHMKADEQALQGPVVVLTMDKDLDSMARYQAMVNRLRREGIRAELYLGAGGMKAQLKYADRRNAPCAVIQGSSERAKDEVQIKDLVEGARLAQSIEDNKEWRSGAAAQSRVKEADLTAAVKAVLARHKAG